MIEDGPVQVEINGQSIYGRWGYDATTGSLSIQPTNTCYIQNEKKRWQFWKPNYIRMKPFTINLC